ncbi:DUF1624 domain-containing protein [Marinoscillum sp. MHG1-6]|uniref:DUF1624 domain-containing protein n=1 Tax=Marinoscillum sp. MHG1-6 TaxID=2959627 RepID=UPI002156FCB0|nr:heparan-alpha-glucosaminide N-acetyltransferase domain-containing protein [Marinoscillum sp. MHG1-6]
MNDLKPQRIESLDILKGLVMVIMALDHTRDYFHDQAFLFDPTDAKQTYFSLYFTRWITHYCAPIFALQAGISAYLVGRRKSKKELTYFLLSRGIWLVFIELTVVNFSWYFDIQFIALGLLVIWVLGMGMIFLAGVIHLPMKGILIISLLIMFGHNLLDYISIEQNLLWSIVHQAELFLFENGRALFVAYPLLPWIGVMSMGYYLGTYYDKLVPAEKRQKEFNIIGLSAVVLFFAIRLANSYGNFHPWEFYESISDTLFSFFDPAKYPPSLTYLLMTLGPAMLFLANTEHVTGKVAEFIKVYGRVPFFYYILHLYLIHLFAMALAEATGFGWESMILKTWVNESPELVGYGMNLGWTYLVWIAVVMILYLPCYKFSQYKMSHKEKKWLSYF